MSSKLLHNLRSGDVERLADAVERLYRPARSGGEAETQGPSTRREDAWAAAQEFFARREATAREDERVSSRLLAHLRAAAPPIPQQVMPLIAAPGQRAGGRFRLRNVSTREAMFTFRPDFPLPVRFSPARLTVPAGGSATVDLRLDVGSATESTTLLVDVLADGRPSLKLWLDLQVDPPVPPDDAGAP